MEKDFFNDEGHFTLAVLNLFLTFKGKIDIINI